MAVTALHPLHEVKNLLEETAAKDDAGRLREMLTGKDLPLLGSGEEPAEMFFRAMSLPPVDGRLPGRVASVAAKLVAEALGHLTAVKEQAGKAIVGAPAVVSSTDAGVDYFLGNETFVFNLFLLSANLPANDDLFSALCGFRDQGLELSVLSRGFGRAERQLRQALIHQQTNQSLERVWIDTINGLGDTPPGYRLTPEQQNALLEAWTGLLWVPPSEEEAAAGEPLSLPRIKEGFLALAKVLDERIEGADLMVDAVSFLDQAYPRSPGFWDEAFADAWDEWPDILQAALLENWPSLAHGPEIDWLPDGAIAVWATLTSTEQAIVAGADTEEVDDLLNKILFEKPRGGLTKQDFGMQIARIKNALPGRDADEHDFEDMLESDRKVQNRRPEAQRKHTRSKGKGIDRALSFSRLNKVLETVDQLLANGNLARAQEYFDDLIEQQESEDTEEELIAKTFCNAASSAKEAGYYAWAEELYRKALQQNPNDAVTHNGLAEVLKARDDLDGAEALYRESIDRWPNNAVSRHGLANILRKRQQFEEALSLIPEPSVASGLQTQYIFHLRGMIALETDDNQEAGRLFDKGLGCARSARQKRIFHKALATMKLRRQRYDEAFEELQGINEGIDAGVDILRLHAFAGREQEKETRRILELVRPKAIRKAEIVVLDSMETAFGLGVKDNFHPPSIEMNHNLTNAEIDMLLAA